MSTPRPARARQAIAALAAAALLVLATACASPSPAPPALPPPPPASPAVDDAAPREGPEAAEAAVLAFGTTHVFPDGNAVSVAAPVAGSPVPGAAFPRTLELTVTVRNGTPAAEDLSRFGYDVTVPVDREAPAIDDGPDGTLAPGEQRSFPLRFALPDAGPVVVTLEVAKADQSAPGQDVPGSDELPGTWVEFEGQV